MGIPIKRVKSLEIKPNNSILKRIISGGEQGAEIAGIRAAKITGFKTGGHMPEDFYTITGEKPGYSWMFGLQDDCPSYEEKTWRNVKDADATIRLGVDFNTEDEYCTLKAIRRYGRPHIDVYMETMWYSGNGEYELRIPPAELAAWIVANKVVTLNITGNIERYLEAPVYLFLLEAFNQIRWE